MSDETTDDSRCGRCNYSLRGLAAGSACPECGSPAENEGEMRIRLAQVRRGLSAYLIGPCAIIGFFVFSILEPGTILEFEGHWALAQPFGLWQIFYVARLVIPVLLMAAAAWLIGTPWHKNERWYPRRMLRVLAVTWVILEVLHNVAVLSGVGVKWHNNLVLISYIHSGMWMWLLWTCLVTELKNLGHGMMATHANILRWAATCTTVGLAIVFIARLYIIRMEVDESYYKKIVIVSQVMESVLRAVVVWMIVMLIRTRSRVAAAAPGGFWTDVHYVALRPITAGVLWILARVQYHGDETENSSANTQPAGDMREGEVAEKAERGE